MLPLGGATSQPSDASSFTSRSRLSLYRWAILSAAAEQFSSASTPANWMGLNIPESMLVLICLLYTSDAADDLLCVDLGGRRIIKKKKKAQKAYQPAWA